MTQSHSRFFSLSRLCLRDLDGSSGFLHNQLPFSSFTTKAVSSASRTSMEHFHGGKKEKKKRRRRKDGMGDVCVSQRR